MNHIFVSYSHKDSVYAHQLADQLAKNGFTVWIDARLDYGSQWPLEIQKQLDNCSAFIVIMTPRAFASEWVQSELQRAKRKMKPIFPILLEGNEPWLSVESTQFYDVRGGKVLDQKFYNSLWQVTQSPGAQKPKNFVAEKIYASRQSSPLQILIIMSVILFVLFGLFALGMYNLPAIMAWINGTPGRTIYAATSEPTERTPHAASAELTQVAMSVITNLPAVSTATPAAILPKFTETPSPAEFTDSIGIPMIYIPAGEFTMGSNSGEADEMPVHQVYLNAYYIDKYEVTNKFYYLCVQNNMCDSPYDPGSYTRPRYFENNAFNNYPVINIGWDQAQRYCQWRGGDLPTEAQWEKAARGDKALTYPWGDGISCDYANVKDCVADTTEVGTYELGKSPYGLFDMSGNVEEWVRDWYLNTYYGESPYENPPGPDPASHVYVKYYVLRGGSWNSEAYDARTTRRGALSGVGGASNGFRCVLPAP